MLHVIQATLHASIVATSLFANAAVVPDASDPAPAVQHVLIVNVEAHPADRVLGSLIRVKQALQTTKGLQDVTIDAAQNRVRATYEPTETNTEIVLSVLDRNGFRGEYGRSAREVAKTAPARDHREPREAGANPKAERIESVPSR